MKKIIIFIFLIILITIWKPEPSQASPQNPNEPCVYENFVSTVAKNPPCKSAFKEGTLNEPIQSNDTGTYHLLAPLPTGLDNIDVRKPGAFSSYLNTMIQLFIGLCAVLAVVMIVIAGMQWATSELISSKHAAEEKIKGAVFGLMLALGSFLLLQEINPDLLNIDINLEEVKVEVDLEKFVLSPAQSINGTSTIKVNFKAEACPAAKAAQEITGVDKDFILAIFSQETAGGANTGGCKPHNANMYPEDIAALERIVGRQNIATTNVSCASGGGHGGAIGLMQFRPTTWLSTTDRADRNPWNVNDALTVAGLLLKKNGAVSDPRNAACKYYSGDACKAGRYPPNEFYGNEVMARMNYIKQKNACL